MLVSNSAFQMRISSLRSDIQERLDDINARAAPVLEEHTRLIGAVNKAVTLVLAMAAVGVFTFALSQADEHYRKVALDQQEQTHVAK